MLCIVLTHLCAVSRTNVKTRANKADKGVGLNKRKIIEQAVVDELCAMVDSGGDVKQVELKKGKPNVVMFVGLQGCGKTTTASKYGAFHKKKGFKPALVCADTFRAGEHLSMADLPTSLASGNMHASKQLQQAREGLRVTCMRCMPSMKCAAA